MSEHRCCVCPVYGRDGEDGRAKPNHIDGWLACEHCQERINRCLMDIADQFLLLDPTPGAGAASDQITGTRERSLGVRINILDLITPATDAMSIHDEHSDQTGTIPVAVVLDRAAVDWCKDRGQDEHLPVPTVIALCAWLRDRLTWACQYYTGIDAFAEEIKDLRGTLYRANGHTNARPERMGAPCPRCDLLNLTREAGDDYIRCDGQLGCGNTMKPEEYQKWSGIVAAWEQQRAA